MRRIGKEPVGHRRAHMISWPCWTLVPGWMDETSCIPQINPSGLQGKDSHFTASSMKLVACVPLDLTVGVGLQDLLPHRQKAGRFVCSICSRAGCNAGGCSRQVYDKLTASVQEAAATSALNIMGMQSPFSELGPRLYRLEHMRRIHEFSWLAGENEHPAATSIRPRRLDPPKNPRSQLIY